MAASSTSIVYPTTAASATSIESVASQWNEVGVQTDPWVHPDGLVPPNPCLQLGSQDVERPKPGSQGSLVTPKKISPPIIPDEELNVRASL